MSAKPVIEIKDVHRHYVMKGETIKALAGVSLTINEGDFLVISGPSGSGKSTLLNLIGALDTPTNGTVLIDGRDLGKLTGKETAELRRDRIGFIFQAYNLIPVLSVLENVEYIMLLQGKPAAERRKVAQKVLDEVGLGDKLDRRPAELSGGQQQRVAVARAIASNPALILADEPTANLDSKTGVALLDTMMHLNETYGTTFVFSTHDPKVIDRASRLISLRDGLITGEDRRR